LRDGGIQTAYEHDILFYISPTADTSTQHGDIISSVDFVILNILTIELLYSLTLPLLTAVAQPLGPSAFLVWSSSESDGPGVAIKQALRKKWQIDEDMVLNNSFSDAFAVFPAQIDTTSACPF
jgi:hypothetical protein